MKKGGEGGNEGANDDAIPPTLVLILSLSIKWQRERKSDMYEYSFFFFEKKKTKQNKKQKKKQKEKHYSSGRDFSGKTTTNPARTILGIARGRGAISGSSEKKKKKKFDLDLIWKRGGITFATLLSSPLSLSLTVFFSPIFPLSFV